MSRRSDVLVLLGAVVGGVVGYLAFFALARRGYYGLAVPGGLLGLGAGIFRRRSIAVPIVCGLAALALGLFTQWRLAPYLDDDSFGYFLAHAHQLPRFTLIMIGAGALIGFWVPFRRSQKTKSDESVDELPETKMGKT